MIKPISVASPQRTEGSLFSNSVISLHLKEFGYPEESIISMNRCQEDMRDKASKKIKAIGHDGKKDDIVVSTIRHWCSLRTCPYCAKKRQRRLGRKYIGYLRQLPRTRTDSFSFLTISPKNYTEDFSIVVPNFISKEINGKKTRIKDGNKKLYGLEAGLIDIRKNFSKFLRLKYIKERIEGALYVIEAKQSWKGQKVYSRKTREFLYKSEEDSWNIHIHAIIYGRRLDNQIRGKCNCCSQNLLTKNHETGEYYCKNHKCNSTDVVVRRDSRLTSLWKGSSGGQEVNMHIIKQKTASHTLNYMLKYISAGPENFKDERGMARYIVATRGTRLISTVGKKFYGVKFDDYKRKKETDGSYTYYMNSPELRYLKFRHETTQESRADRDRRVRRERKQANAPPPPKSYVDLNGYI